MTDAADAVPPVPDLRHVGVWTAELLSVPVGLARAYLPGRLGLGARTREQLIIAVSTANGLRTTAWVHGAWLDFIGRREGDEALAPLLEYARACAEAGVPLDATSLRLSYPPSVVRSVRATVAVAQLDGTAAAVAEQAWQRVRDRRRPPLDTLVGLAGLGLAAPLVAPSLALAGTLRLLTRLAPPIPALDVPPSSEANLVVHLLADALPAYLGHVVVRTGVVWSPVPLALAVRLDGTSATVRIGRGRVVIRNGIEPDAVAVVDGGVEPLLAIVAGSILRDLGVPVRRQP